METNFLLKGIILGFTIAAAIGPIAILCINRGLTRGFLSGFISGLGAATADAVYSVIAAFGLTFISSFLIEQQLWLRIIGVIFLLYLGIKTLIKKPQEQKGENVKEVKTYGLFKDYISTFLLTTVNPMTILSFAAVFAGLGLVQTSKDYFSASMLVIGFFIGSALLYFILSLCVGVFHKKVNSSVLTWANRISGLIIIGFAVLICVSLVNAN